MDSGASASIIHDSFIHTNKYDTRKTFTMAGSFSTLCEAKVKPKLPELNFTAHIFALFHLTSQKSRYSVIFDRDLLQELKTKIIFTKKFVG